MIKTKTWIIGIAALLLLSTAALFLAGGVRITGAVAKIYVDGQCVRSIDLNQVTKRETITIPGKSGYNTICVEQGRIRIIEADCPDQICVNSEWLTDSARPIVCLPHRLVIQLEEPPVSSQSFHERIDTVSQ